jgi:hypothetical protein
MLKFDIADAAALAAQGKPAEGCELLAAGLHRAEAARDEGQPWGEELVRRYQEALQQYAQQHGLPS